MAFTAGQKIRAADLNQPFGHAGITSGFVSTNGGVYPTVAAQSLQNGMTFSSNALVVPKAGLYLILAKLYASGSSPHFFEYMAALNTTANPPAGNVVARPSGSGTFYKPDGNDYTAVTLGHAQLAANDAIRLFIKTSTAVNTWGANGYDGAFIEVLRIQD